MLTQTVPEQSYPALGNEEPSRRACLTAILRMAGMRPTRQRLDLADRLINRDRHVTAEDLFMEVSAAGQELSLATVYNTLKQFQGSGLVRELAKEGSRSVFDTNTTAHHHYYVKDDHTVIDIPGNTVRVSGLPPIPEGYVVDEVQVVVRLRRR